MWDEYDEGTQFLPAIMKAADLPQDDGGKFKLIAGDIDGYDVPSDWYMRIAGYGSSLVKSERNNDDRFPEKILREWEPKYEVRPTVHSMLASGSGNVSSDTNTQRPSYRNAPGPRRVAADREQEDPPPPPYTREPDDSAKISTVVSPGPEPPISTRPDIPQPWGDSRPPPRVPPRLSPQVGLSAMSHPSVAPAIPFASRPAVNTPPHSPHSPGPPVPPKRGPSPAGYHGKPPSSPHHLPANQPAPMESPYPYLMPMPQVLSGAQYQMNDTIGGPNSYAPSQVTMPQPGNSWYPQPNTQPAWPNQYWNNPNEMAPAVRAPPPPGQHLGVYSFDGGYDDSFSFPEATRPSASYRDGYSTSQPPPMLDPQQHNPVSPPPHFPSRESPASTLLRRGEYRVCIILIDATLTLTASSRPPPHPPRPSSAQSRTPSTHSHHHTPPPPSPYRHSAPSSPGQHQGPQGQHGAEKSQKGTLTHKLSSVSAGSSCLAPILSYFRCR